jgi:hypothetical protein
MMWGVAASAGRLCKKIVYSGVDRMIYPKDNHDQQDDPLENGKLGCHLINPRDGAFETCHGSACCKRIHPRSGDGTHESQESYF